jgi:hypothetical protein
MNWRTTYLAAQGLEPLWPEVDLIIQQHHKLRQLHRDRLKQSVEAFRRADRVDLSLGLVRTGLSSRAFVRAVRLPVPQCPLSTPASPSSPASSSVRTPWNPLPMMRW